jgi:hypothetical protein
VCVCVCVCVCVNMCLYNSTQILLLRHVPKHYCVLTCVEEQGGEAHLCLTM